MHRWIGLLVGTGIAATGNANVTSTFDADAEGWGTLNDATSFAWSGTEGNPAGSVSAVDQRQGPIWYFAASSAYLGDQSASLGLDLSWDILGLVGSQTSVTNRADVMLLGGASTNGAAIGIDADVIPQLDEWTPWSVTLGGAGWQSVDLSSGSLSGADVSEATIAAILADLAGVYIRGEYTNGSDSTALDNVSLAVPTPGAISVLVGVGLLTTRRRR
ncbi:MAG: laminin B domain-containing protein [Planctomycetota bacterium]